MRWNSSASTSAPRRLASASISSAARRIRLFGGHLQELARIAQAARQAVETVDHLFEPGAFLAEILRAFRVVPDAGLLELANYFLQPFVLVVVIKDTSSRKSVRSSRSLMNRLS